MLIKIGTAWVDPEEILAITPSQSMLREDHAQICVMLRHGGGFFLELPMGEAEAALRAAGLLAEPEPASVVLTDEQTQTLWRLRRDGYRYLARDRNGRVYAYFDEPVRSGAYWETPEGDAAASAQYLAGDWPMLAWEDYLPTYIDDLLGGE